LRWHYHIRATSWEGGEHARVTALAACDRQGVRLARDLAEAFVEDLNERNGMRLRLAKNGGQGEPDFVYEDGSRKLTVALEVKRAWNQERRERRAELETFRKLVSTRFPRDFRGRYRVLFSPCWRPPARAAQRGQTQEDLAARFASALVQRTAQLPSLGREVPNPTRLVQAIHMEWGRTCENEELAAQAIDMRDICEAMVIRYDDTAQPADLLVVPAPLSWEQQAPVFYRELVDKANDQLRRYREQGAETMLLLDCRLGSDLLPAMPWDLRAYHEDAARDPNRPHPLSPIGLRWGDFSSIVHVLTFQLGEMGIHVTTLWRDPSARVNTFDDWSIQPQGWYDDQ
jgi:hypothetical protein